MRLLPDDSRWWPTQSDNLWLKLMDLSLAWFSNIFKMCSRFVGKPELRHSTRPIHAAHTLSRSVWLHSYTPLIKSVVIIYDVFIDYDFILCERWIEVRQGLFDSNP